MLQTTLARRRIAAAFAFAFACTLAFVISGASGVRSGTGDSARSAAHATELRAAARSLAQAVPCRACGGSGVVERRRVVGWSRTRIGTRLPVHRTFAVECTGCRGRRYASADRVLRLLDRVHACLCKVAIDAPSSSNGSDGAAAAEARASAREALQQTLAIDPETLAGMLAPAVQRHIDRARGGGRSVVVAVVAESRGEGGSRRRGEGASADGDVDDAPALEPGRTEWRGAGLNWVVRRPLLWDGDGPGAVLLLGTIRAPVAPGGDTIELEDAVIVHVPSAMGDGDR